MGSILVITTSNDVSVGGEYRGIRLLRLLIIITSHMDHSRSILATQIRNRTLWPHSWRLVIMSTQQQGKDNVYPHTVRTRL
jgi:hypothetical protein